MNKYKKINLVKNVRYKQFKELLLKLKNKGSRKLSDVYVTHLNKTKTKQTAKGLLKFSNTNPQDSILFS